MNTKNLIYGRKSATAFSSKKVEQEKVKTIVEAGNYAPIFGSIHFTVIENENLINQVKSTTIEMMKNSGNEFAEKQASSPNYDPIYNATSIIVLSAENGNDSQGFNMANVACAAENMLLMATDLGVGSRYVMAPVMAFLNPVLGEQAAFPENYVPLCIVLLGNTDGNIFVERTKSTDNISYVK